jgi:hypothetical protein
MYIIQKNRPSLLASKYSSKVLFDLHRILWKRGAVHRLLKPEPLNDFSITKAQKRLTLIRFCLSPQENVRPDAPLRPIFIASDVSCQADVKFFNYPTLLIYQNHHLHLGLAQCNGGATPIPTDLVSAESERAKVLHPFFPP